MTKTIFASTIALLAFAATSFASVPAIDQSTGYKAGSDISDMEAKRRKPRIPGGSGCDSPRDVREHPECSVKKADATVGEESGVIYEAKRRKPRVPGGSGCDSPRDIIEHPECRVKKV